MPVAPGKKKPTDETTWTVRMFRSRSVTEDRPDQLQQPRVIHTYLETFYCFLSELMTCITKCHQVHDLMCPLI